jgi:regulator of sigma E protease
LPPGPLVPYTVRRDGAELTVPGPTPFLPVVGALAPNSAAYDVEMKVGDVILSVDGSPVYAFSDLVARVSQSGGRALLLEVWRDGQRLTFSVVPRRQDLPLPDGGFETRWLIGIIAGQFFTPDTVTPGPIQALGMAAGQVWFIITSSLSGLWHIVTGAISTCNLSGPVGIAQTSGAMASQGASDFIWFVAVLSTAVGLLNLFPVPMLDGGHLVFYAWEGATGRPPGERALRVLMAAGLTLILALMVFALANDLFLCP